MNAARDRSQGFAEVDGHWPPIAAARTRRMSSPEPTQLPAPWMSGGRASSATYI